MKLEMQIRKFSKYGLLLFFTCLISWHANAQADRIALALEDGNLKRALKLAEDSEEDQDLKKDPEVYFLKAETLYRIIHDEFLATKYPEALKDGIKAIERGRGRSGGQYPPEYEELVDRYVALNNEAAAREYGVNKYTKAIKLYETSYELNGDMTAIFWIGRSYLWMQDTTLGEENYNRIIHWSNNESAEGREVKKDIVEAYVYYGDKYWQRKQYDSANLYLEAARKVFGSNSRIDYFQKEVTKEQIKSLPPSSLMMEKIKHTLDFFPTDTFFIQKENALYLYLMRNNLANSDTMHLDTMIARFAAEKVARNNSNMVGKYKLADQFLEAKEENVLWKLVKYFSKFNHEDMSNYIAHKYIEMTAKSNSDEDMISRYAVIIDYAAKSHSLYLADQLLTLGESVYGPQETFTQIRSSLVSKNEGKELNTQNLGALYELVMKQTPDLARISESTQKLASKYIDALIQDKEYATVKPIILKHYNAQPENPIWSRKLDYLAKEDFFNNYYNTRVREEVVAGMKIEGFVWDGSTVNCNPGEVSPEIQKKVEDRINYFRRQAGVPEIYLDPELNGWCQKTALMMEANKNLSHEPDSRWRCYSDEGAHAARYSLLTKGATTTLAVTSFFADQQNPSVGNRRWLLYPNGAALGHGSTENACAIWALDDSGSVDTNLYKEQFIAWPPEGNLPKMIVFRYWSFSVKQDLEGATVKMTSGDEDIPLKIQELVDGYGLPTLVWEPQIDLKGLTNDKPVEVVVTLKNGRRYSYNVNIMNFDPVGY